MNASIIRLNQQQRVYTHSIEPDELLLYIYKGIRTQAAEGCGEPQTLIIRCTTKMTKKCIT